MTATTSPDNIVYWTTSDPASIVAESAAQATSIQAALTQRFTTRQGTNFVWPNAAGRAAETQMTAGSTGYQTDTKERFEYTGSAWVLLVRAGATTMIPTLVVASTGTVTQANGKVSVNQVPSNLRLDGVFTSAYQNYRIFVDIDAASTSTQFGMQFANAGVVDSTTNYDFSRIYNNGTTPTATTTATTPVSAFTPTALGGTRISSVIEVSMLPGSRKAVSAQTECSIATGTAVIISMGGQYRVTTAVDGLNISPNANVTTAGAQMSVSVLGYNP